MKPSKKSRAIHFLKEVIRDVHKEKITTKEILRKCTIIADLLGLADWDKHLSFEL